MNKLFFSYVLFLVTGSLSGFSQTKQNYKISVISFYNLENLYDTIDNPMVDDNEFTPAGPKKYNGEIYFDKLQKLSTVIAEMGADKTPDGPAILGVAEIENDTVLADLVRHPLIAKRNYKIVHYDSRDARGVDVGLLYNPKYFIVEASNKLFVQLPSGAKDAYYTRDVLWVKGKLDGETMHIYVNHWPSRRGGEKRSEPGRMAAAKVCRDHMDSILKAEPDAKFVVMGDLNDDPLNKSITEVIGAKAEIEEVKDKDMYNPWTELYNKGIGTLAYQDAWGLFDQILISGTWLSHDQSGFFFKSRYIFNKPYLVENMGRYKGYPMRTWDGNIYRGGYSDHFPTYIVLLKKTP